jgi:hypothetical protein
MPRYHLFGESVDIAHLMEQMGAPGEVQVSENVANVLGDRFLYQGHRLLDVSCDKQRLTEQFCGSRRRSIVGCFARSHFAQSVAVG